MLAASICYVFWGLVPLYWRQLATVGAVELIAHRQLWSLLLLAIIVAGQRGFGAIGRALSTPRLVGINGISAVLLCANWLVYVWAVNHGHVVESSLGYFLVPLANVAAGRFLLHEHLRRLQVIAIGFAVLGVGLMIAQLGRAPWIALTLAGSWGGYSLLRKKSPLPAITGLTVETLLLSPFAVAFLAWLHLQGTGVIIEARPATLLLLAGSGVITAVPLLLFGYGAQRIRLSTLGLLQYVAPSVQLLLGVWVFQEPFPRARMISFGLIWIGLAIYTADNLLAQRRLRAG